MRVFFKVLLIISLLNLAACSSNYTNYAKKARVYERSRGGKYLRRSHVVESGESLYSISFRYGVDLRELAAINRIREPYKIMPGQKMYLDRKSYNTLNTKKKTSERGNIEVKADDTGSQIVQKDYDNQSVTTTSWKWPASGKIASVFNSEAQFNNGIDIAVKTTTSVKAAADGKIVYQGSGLKGYGKLIIIRHNNEYLSAYAHNDLFLAKEGDVVQQGQSIAYVGVGQEFDKKLHFEIRKNGKPVDPLKYLPD